MSVERQTDLQTDMQTYIHADHNTLYSLSCE